MLGKMNLQYFKDENWKNKKNGEMLQISSKLILFHEYYSNLGLW
jgi:hypothetical protein